MTDLHFKAQSLRIRPHQYETPYSYLARLCEANVIDQRVVMSAVLKRRQITNQVTKSGRHNHLALVIQDLGGPGVKHFAKSYVRASGRPVPDDPEKLLADTYRKRTKGTRWACTYCTAGQPVQTYGHHQFNVCVKHGRWLAPDHDAAYQRQVPDTAEWVRAERRYRRAVGTGFLTWHLTDITWQAVRDQAEVLGPAAWTDRLGAAQDDPGFVKDVDDRLALYPETTRVLHLLSKPRTWDAIDTLHSSPEHLRAYLRRGLAWVAGEQWVLVEALSLEVVRSRRSRIKELNALLRTHFASRATS